MRSTTTLIVGAGQCGLAMSHELTRRSIDHIVLDAGQAGESWRTRRWPSLTLLTPNWMNLLPGQRFARGDPDDYMTARGFADAIGDWVERHDPPLLGHTKVHSLTRDSRGFRAETSNGPICSRSAVIATGACAIPRIPSFAAEIPAHAAQVSPIDYRGPAELPPGDALVVGASASGLQIARELALSGRNVTIAAGNHGRLPRVYRDADILMWMHLIGVFDEPFTDVDDLERVRRTPSLPLIGSPDRECLDLNSLQDLGVEVVGRLADVRDGSALFSGGLPHVAAAADLKMNRLLNRIDQWVRDHGFEDLVAPTQRFAPTRLPAEPRLTLDLNTVKTVVWATGFTPDHQFVRMPVFDRKGRIRHQGGFVAPGLYVMGLPYLRTARSVHIDGAQQDAAALACLMSRDIDRTIAA
ncbi:flavin-containing monooxygenase [Roseibium sp.]|uniref:flavin-containing monooxygenase n=1 Tax=Roseibium sp. TaxID=1936156 RepID=UPI003D0C873D